MQMKGKGWITGAALAFGLAWAPTASALTVSSGGINSTSANFGCSTTSPCSSNKTFTLSANGAASGTIDVTGATQVTILLTVPSFSMSGPPGFSGIDQVDFTGVTYSAVLNGVTVSAGGLTGGSGTGTVSGSYTQKNAGSTIVASTAFSESALFFNLNCSTPGGVGTCALQVGSGTAGNFDLDINGGGLNRFVNVFNVGVVPEPATAGLLGGGLLLLALARRRVS